VSTAVQTDGVSRRFLTNTILNYLGQGFILVLTFATAPYIVHRLGPELFGVVTLVQVTAGFAGLLNLGIGRALTKYVSELYWKRDFLTINQLFQTAWTTCIVAGLVGLILLIAPKELIGRLFFRGGPEVDAVVGFAIYVAAFGLFTAMLLEALSALPVATQRFGISNAINVLVGAVRCLGPVLVLANGYSIRAVLIAILASNLLAVMAFVLASRSLIPGLSFMPAFSWSLFRKLFGFSLPLLLSALFAMIVTRADRFILAYYLPLAAVTFYTLPYSVAEKASAGVANITSVVFPFISELHSMGAHTRVQELYLKSTKALAVVTLPITVILFVLQEHILHFWLGEEYAAQGASILGVLGIATFLNGATGVATVASQGLGQTWMPAVFVFISSAINLVLNITLIPPYGIDGAAYAALVPAILLGPLFVYMVTRKLGLSFWELFSKSLLRPLLCASVQFAILFYCRRYVSSLETFGMLCLVSLCLYGTLSIVWVMTQQEKSAVLRLLPLRLRSSWPKIPSG
jgi:O-antigen/teichoic acid export membrane protein